MSSSREETPGLGQAHKKHTENGPTCKTKKHTHLGLALELVVANIDADDRDTRGLVPQVAELLQPVCRKAAGPRGERLAHGGRVSESGGVEGVVHLVGRRARVAVEDDLGELRLFFF